MTLSPADQDIAALRAAMYLSAVPSSCAQLRKEPLPNGIGLLLCLVANERDVQQFYAARLEKTAAELREVSAFYLEQIMLTPGADSYRALGAKRDAPAAELRRNLSLLCRWLHSDICDDLSRSVFFLRVTQAWNDLKTPERRAAYDASLGAGAASQIDARSERVNNGHRGAKHGVRLQTSQGAQLSKKGRERRAIHLRQNRLRGIWRFLIG